MYQVAVAYKVAGGYARSLGNAPALFCHSQSDGPAYPGLSEWFLASSSAASIGDDFTSTSPAAATVHETPHPHTFRPSQCSVSPSLDPQDALPRPLLESRPPSPAASLPHLSCLRRPPLPRPLFPPSDATRRTPVSQKMRFRAVSSTS